MKVIYRKRSWQINFDRSDWIHQSSMRLIEFVMLIEISWFHKIQFNRACYDRIHLIDLNSIQLLTKLNRLNYFKKIESELEWFDLS